MKSALFLFLVIPFLSFGQSNIKLLSFESSSCDREADIFRIQKRIVNQSIDGGIYKLTIGVIANCAGIHDLTTIFRSDTLRINYEEGRLVNIKRPNKKIDKVLEKASCDCCFEYNLTIKGLAVLPQIITVNDSVIKYFPEKYMIYQVKYEISNGDTINYVDKYGFKQRKWQKTKENNGYFSGYYIDDKLKTADSKEYYPNGRLKSMLFQENFKKSRFESYFENGQLSFQVLDNDSLGTISTSFYENGILKRLFISIRNYSEEKLFYPNGNIQKITGNNIHQDYYPTGNLKEEFFFLGDHDILYKFYYPEGQLMATRKVNNDKRIDIWNYYDRNKKPTTKLLLRKQGFKFKD